MNEQAPSKDVSTQVETYWHIAEQLRAIADNIETHQFPDSAELLRRYASILDDASAPEPPAALLTTQVKNWFADHCGELPDDAYHALANIIGDPDVKRAWSKLRASQPPPADAPRPVWSEALQDDIYYASSIDPYIDRLRAARPPMACPWGDHSSMLGNFCSHCGAALTKEVKPVCQECRGAGKICTGNSGREDDGYAPILERCEACDGSGLGEK